MKNTCRSILVVVALAIFTASTATLQGEDYLYETNNATITITGYTGPGGNVSIPSVINALPVTSIGATAFSCCTSITSITIPYSVTNIGFRALGSLAWGQCMSLIEINVDPLNTKYSSANGALYDKKQTTLIQYPERRSGNYVIPPTVVEIGEGAFFYCEWLSNVTIPAGVTSVGRWAFSGCTTLTNAILPETIRKIGQGAFIGCGFTSIAIPRGVTEVEIETFINCTSLTNLILPNTISAIDHGAFENCTSLTGVYCWGNAPSLADASVFLGDHNATIYYLPGTTGWGVTFGGRPTAPWALPYPVILTTAPDFGNRTNGFGFRISWATNATVVVETATTLVDPGWSPVSTNALTHGYSDFDDLEWRNRPARFYRIRQL